MIAKRLLIACLLLAFALVSTACGIASVSTEGGELTIIVNVSESQANRLIDNVFTSNDGDDYLFTQITGVDLIEPDIMRVSGTTADGASGTYDLTIGVVDEAIKIEVVAVDVPGVTMDDPRVQAANDELERAFLENASSDGGDGVINVAVVGDELVFTIKAPLN